MKGGGGGLGVLQTRRDSWRFQIVIIWQKTRFSWVRTKRIPPDNTKEQASHVWGD